MIRSWIESGTQHTGTYAGLATGMIITKGHQSLNPGLIRRVYLDDIVEKRCSSCHDELPLDSELLYNLSRPEKSLALLAPLAKEAGGYDLCKTKDNLPVFADTANPDYISILDMIKQDAEKLKRIKRFDMPGFMPRKEYIREMKRYGFLPEDFNPNKDVIDPYEIDDKYFRSFWHKSTEP